MKKPKNVMIPYDLMMDLIRYFFWDDMRDDEMEQSIKKRLNEKMDAIVKHENFTKDVIKNEKT